MMSKGLFVLGTGTDIGKTYVTGLLLKYIRDNGYNATYGGEGRREYDGEEFY